MHLEQGEKPPIGVAIPVADGVRRILAPNPSPMTFWGTNTYLLGTRALAVIDPGPDCAAHLDAILSALEPGQRISHILVTHAHLDHSPLAAPLAQRTGAPVLAHGNARTGRSAIMEHLSREEDVGGGEGVDDSFEPDMTLQDGDEVAGDGWALRALWTPGHFGNHMCFAQRETVFCGDLVLGWASSLVSPPDGDLTQFMASCARLRALSPGRLLPGHGAAIDDPRARLDWLMSHRRAREAAILETLSDGAQTAEALARRIYTDTPPHLLPAAARNVLAHLIDLTGKSLVRPKGAFHRAAAFERTGPGPGAA